jgi:hypothetical protein
LGKTIDDPHTPPTKESPDAGSQQLDKQKDPAKIPGGKKCVRPKKNLEDNSQLAPLTNADWDQIEACAVANWKALWKAQEEGEAALKEKKKNQMR